MKEIIKKSATTPVPKERFLKEKRKPLPKIWKFARFVLSLSRVHARTHILFAQF